MTDIALKIGKFAQGNIARIKAEGLKGHLLLAFFYSFSALAFPIKSVNAQTLVKFVASGSYESNEVLLRAKLYKPAGEGKFPAVVLMHGCMGWQPSVEYSLQSHANYLVNQGYAVLSVDSFGPRHIVGGKICKSYQLLMEARKYRTSDAFDALHYLQAQSFVDPENVFLMGQSNGGSVAIISAKKSTERDYGAGAPGFRAIVAYYPWCGAFGGSRVTLGTPLIVFGGGQDDWVPPEGCEKVLTSGADYQVHIYPNAVHSFDLGIMKQRYNGKLVGYSKSATQDSRAKMAAFFNGHLTPERNRIHLSRQY